MDLFYIRNDKRMQSLIFGLLFVFSYGVSLLHSFGISRISNSVITRNNLSTHPEISVMKKIDSFQFTSSSKLVVALSSKRRSRAVEEEEEEEEEDEDEEFWDDAIDNSNRRPQWESCGDLANAKVLLPSSPSLPAAILHFIGGTGFGTFPQFTYGTFLEELSLNGNYIVVSTPPEMVSIKNSNPLNHQRIAYECVKSFRIAYRTIIEEEYGVGEAQSIPIVGLGHSMGSRIHVILNTYRNLRRIGFPREGNILLSFNNYDATQSIPFLYEVGMISQNAFQSLLSTTSTTWDAVKNNEWLVNLLSESPTKASKKKNISNKSRRRDYYYYDNDDDDDDIWDDDDDEYYDARTRRRRQQQQQQQQSIRDQTRKGMEWISTQLKEQLSKTNNNNMLEFQPSPEELIQFVSTGKYGVPKTLLIQFDQDDLDQSSVLARALLKQQQQQQQPAGADNHDTDGDETRDSAATASKSNPNEEDSKEKLSNEDINTTSYTDLLYASKMDVKFAHLKGTHLTPIIRDPTSFAAARRNKKDLRLQQRQEYPPPPEEDEIDKDIQRINQELQDLISTITTYIDQIIIVPSYSI